MFGRGERFGSGSLCGETIVDFHVMPAGLGAYPIIPGRASLCAVSAVQDWR